MFVYGFDVRSVESIRPVFGHGLRFLAVGRTRKVRTGDNAGRFLEGDTSNYAREKFRGNDKFLNHTLPSLDSLIKPFPIFVYVVVQAF